jgi:hypothetical protein
VSYSQLFSYYYLFSFRVLIVMERSDSHTYHISGFRPTIMVIGKGTLFAEYAHRGGMRVKK